MSATAARRELFPLIKKVNTDCVEIEITSMHGNVVLMSADEYAAWRETRYLFASPENARRLLDAAASDERILAELDRA
jgi:antitoxin YefM